MRNEQRSGCPINLSLEIFGDRWSLIVIRDLMFGNRRHFRELLSQSEEGIASNILSARLKHLLDLGMITKADDPTHKQKAIYSLTEKAIELVPVFAMLGTWGRRHLPVSRELSIRAQLLEEGGRTPGGSLHGRIAHPPSRHAQKARRALGLCRAARRLRKGADGGRDRGGLRRRRRPTCREQLAKKYGGQIVSKPQFVGKEMRSSTLEYTVRFANP